MNEHSMNTGPAQYENKENTAKRLGISKRTLENWVKIGAIPMIKLGSRCLFVPQAVDAALSKRMVHGR